MEKIKKKKKCENCGKAGARRVIDPYRDELYEEQIYMVLCEPCLQERHDAI